MENLPESGMNGSTRKMREFEVKAWWDDLSPDETLRLFRESNSAIGRAVMERGAEAIEEPEVQHWCDASEALWGKLSPGK